MPETRIVSGSGTRSAGLALGGLLAVAAAWGSSFPLTKTLLAHMSALNFLAVRFTLAGLLMLVVFQRAVRALSRRALRRGVLLGIAYGVAQIIQTIGLDHTSASVSGFITGMYVVLTPLCGAALLRTPIGGRAWVGAVVATVGLAVLALRGFELGPGEALTLASAVVYALHIVGLGAWSTAREAVGLATVQMVMTGVVSLVPALVVGLVEQRAPLVLPTSAFDWAALVYMAVVSGAVAMIVQSWAQAHLAPSRAAIIMSTEPVWAAGFAIGFLGEPLTWRIAAGGGLMLAAMLIVELRPHRPGEPPRVDELPKPAP